MTETTQTAAWEAEARKLGREAGEAAGSWAADGNTTDEHRRNVLAMLEDGDPEAWDYLPNLPNLSGEWADAPTPRSLFEDVTGLDAHAEATFAQDAYQDVLEPICQAWEDAVSETFEAACVSELKAGLSD